MPGVSTPCGGNDGVMAGSCGRRRPGTGWFPLVGRGARRHVRDLLGRDEIDLVASPRHATVLLMAGQIPVAWDGFTDRVHDQLPHPRIVVHAPWDPGDLVEDWLQHTTP